MKGVIDRVQKGIATILVEEEGLEFNVDVGELPEEAEQGSWLRLETDNGQLISAEIDTEKTEEKTKQAGEKLGELREESEQESKHKRVE